MRVGEIHVLVGAAGGERLVDKADLLEQVLPVDVRDQAQAGDDVAHGDAGRALPPMDLAHDNVGGRAAAPPDAGRARSAPGVIFGSWSRSLWMSWTAKASERASSSWSASAIFSGFGFLAGRAQQTVGEIVRRDGAPRGR